MNAIKVLGHLMNLPVSEREVVIELARNMSDSLPKKRAVKIQKKQARKGVGPYSSDDRNWLNNEFMALHGTGREFEAFPRIARHLDRSVGAIERKWGDFISGRSDVGTWQEWVNG